MVAIDDISLETKIKAAAVDPDVYRDAPKTTYFHKGGGRGNRRVFLRAVNRGAGPCFGGPPLPPDSSVVKNTANGVVSLSCRGENGISGTQPVVSNLYQVPMVIGMDSVTDLYYARNRNYSPSLGRWINQDPAGYINGANTYQFVMSNPVGSVDPWGLDKSDAFVNGLAAQLGEADELNNQVQNTGQTGGQVLGQAIQQQVPAPLLAAANLPNAVNPHTLAEGLADTAQGVQNGLIGMINFDFNHGPVGLALHALQQWVKSMRGWLSNIPSPQWDPYSDPTKLWSEGLGAFAGPNLLLGTLGELGAAENAGVSVLGPYPGYIDLANEMNANFFSIPMDQWNAMTEAELWAANRAFLNGAIARGDTFYLSAPYSTIDPDSYTAMEISYLESQGYTLSPGGTQLIPPSGR